MAPQALEKAQFGIANGAREAGATTASHRITPRRDRRVSAGDLAGRRHRAFRHHADQVGAVIGVGVEV
ncbi:MAG TPA: hypothetical protein VN637_17545, partial [Roseiarcus sp.]|nr:hypothetical protein [Roseiarcus sp.]